MKKLWIAIISICILTSCLFIVLYTINKHTPGEDPQGNSQDNSQNQTQNDNGTTRLFSDYQSILDTISVLHAEGDSFDSSEYANLDERESAIYNSLPHFICGGSGYCIKDINNDKVDELIMLTEWQSLKGIFTLKDGLPVLLEVCDDGGIGKDGKIRAEYVEETSEYIKTVYRLKYFAKNALATEVELEEIDYTEDDKHDEYYQITDGERVKKYHNDFINIHLAYSFRDYHDLSSDAGIVCTRLLDIPTVIDSGEYFSKSVLKDQSGNNIYYLKVYDKYGNIVSWPQGEDVDAYEFKANDQETIVKIYRNDKIIYYNVYESRFSEEFDKRHYTENGRNIFFVSELYGNKRLVVRDIFDVTRLYRVYDHEAANCNDMSARFSQDGKSITLKYTLPGAQHYTTRVLCLENLPILKTQKICYVRYETSIHSDCVMVSSGVRAVLRADTGDTIRLLRSLIGEKYTSDDGTVRSDWYCIDYRGEICYVTADSFEWDQQFDIPEEENVPYYFISAEERLSWRDKIIAVLSDNLIYEDIEWGGLGAALMDINLDGIPELITAGSGGSMGNVALVVYDIESGEKICAWGDTPHYWSLDNVYLCLYRNSEGNYIVLNEGSLRFGPEGYYVISVLNENFKFDAIFEKVSEDMVTKGYYFNRAEVSKTEFERQQSLFEAEYQEISSTRMKIIYWDDIEVNKSNNKNDAISLMADALINSEQEFIDFNIDYREAYLDFLKDKKEAYDSFALVYVDDDDIPELYLSGRSEAEGDTICSLKNGVVVYQHLHRTGGGKYIERSGSMINQNGHMGSYYDTVYKLGENGFSLVLNARYTDKYEHIGNDEYNILIEYFIDDTIVSETEYNNAVNAAFDLSNAKRFNENTVSYDAIIRELGGDNAAK